MTAAVELHPCTCRSVLTAPCDTRCGLVQVVSGGREGGRQAVPTRGGASRQWREGGRQAVPTRGADAGSVFARCRQCVERGLPCDTGSITV